MNDTDRQILALLRRNARLPVTEIAGKVGVSRATVQKRIDLMETRGIIGGYTVILNSEVDHKQIYAWMSIAVEGNKASSIIHVLQGEPAIRALHTTNGRWDILVKICSETLGEFDSLLGRVRKISGVANTETCILLSKRKG